MKPIITMTNLEILKQRLNELADQYAQAEEWKAAFAIIEALCLIIDHETYLD